jgi:hypothetical protein
VSVFLKDAIIGENESAHERQKSEKKKIQAAPAGAQINNNCGSGGRLPDHFVYMYGRK